MKSNVKHLFQTKLLTNLFFASVIFFSPGLKSLAQQPDHQTKPGNGAITYRGSVDDKLVFNLSVENRTESRIAVIILDENGERIFRGTFKGKKIDKLFKVPDDSYTFTFIISNPEEKSVQHFKINTERRYVEDVTITKNL